MHVGFDINDSIFAGAGAGAVGMSLGLFLPALPLLPIVLIMAAAGKADLRKRNLIKILPYAVIGAVIGGIGAAAGLSWWAAGLVAFGTGVAFELAFLLRQRRKRHSY